MPIQSRDSIAPSSGDGVNRVANGAGTLIATKNTLVALLGAVTEPALLVNDVQ